MQQALKCKNCANFKEKETQSHLKSRVLSAFYNLLPLFLTQTVLQFLAQEKEDLQHLGRKPFLRNNEYELSLNAQGHQTVWALKRNVNLTDFRFQTLAIA
jgi:hypothetical protein